MLYFQPKQEKNVHLAAQLYKLDKFNCKTSTIQWILYLL